MVELEGIIQVNLLATNLMGPVLLIMPLLALACWIRSFTSVFTHQITIHVIVPFHFVLRPDHLTEV